MEERHTSFPLLAPENSSAGPGARDWVRMAWRQRWLLGGCTLLAGAVALGFVAAQPAHYASTAKVWIQTEQQATPSFLSGIAGYREAPAADPINRKIETEMGLMLTRAVAHDAIEKLDVHADQLVHTPLEQALMRLKPARPADDAAAPHLEELFLKSLTVTPLRSGTADTTSNVLEVRFECNEPALAANALQAVLDSYLKLGARQNLDVGRATAQLIGAKLVEARKELQDVETGLLKLALRGPGREEPSAAALPEERTGNLPGTGNGIAMRFEMGPELSGNSQTQSMIQLKNQVMDLQIQLDALRALYTDDADNVRALRQRLDEAQARLRAGIAEGARADAERTRLERLRTLAQDRFLELQRKHDQLDLYLRLNPTETASRIVVDAPVAPEKPEPARRSLLVALGLAAGLMLGLLLAGVREMFDTRLHTAEDVRRQLGLPVLGTLPRWRRGERERLKATGA